MNTTTHDGLTRQPAEGESPHEAAILDGVPEGAPKPRTAALVVAELERAVANNGRVAACLEEAHRNVCVATAHLEAVKKGYIEAIRLWRKLYDELGTFAMGDSSAEEKPADPASPPARRRERAKSDVLAREAQDVVEAIRDNHAPATMEVLRAVQCTGRGLGAALRRGLVRRPRRGVYELPEPAVEPKD